MPEPIEVKPRQLNSILADIDCGLLKIPRFQREVVWELDDSVKLLDSIYRGFPIGSIVVWETNEELSEVRAIGDLTLPDPPKGQTPSYVLDGQQRLTSLYACARQAKVSSKKRRKPVDYIGWFDLDNKCFTTAKPANAVTFQQLIATCYDEYREVLPQPLRPVFSEARKILLEDYRFSIIVVRDRNLEDACLIFERINNSGKKLTVFDLLVAKAYPLNFDLREEWKRLDRELQAFKGLNPIIPMQALSLMTVKLDQEKLTDKGENRYGCHKRHLLKLPPSAIKEKWLEVKNCVKLAIDFVANQVGVPTAKLLPYEAPIVLYALFFALNKKNSPNAQQARQLEEHFWRSSISGRYAQSPESMLEEDSQSVRDIVAGIFSGWRWGRAITDSEILTARYDRRDASVLTILCLLASRRPISFKSGIPIPVAKEFSQFNSTELHHIFPRGWLKQNARKEWIEQENTLANICLAPSKEQRYEIRAKSPAEYLALFQNNDQLNFALESHYISGEMVQALLSNDFDSFIRQRSVVLTQALNRKSNLNVNEKS